ncbi:hypothetical protein KIN20_003016 [Parelaphostrongylus tenuis]|uniref:Uncharacterized protein n=1 Tax=Parelaphostrongylus tenuis TaxID=148309 RepID=A0AAD5MHN9_PARTN|nr:hypothetical protein KIN20_003016 [Parelaphostrongylus tenuis]
MLFANIDSLPFSAVMSKEKDGEASGEEDWEGFEDEELETMLESLAVSADEDIGNESDSSLDKNVHTSQCFEDDDDGLDDAQGPFLNVDIVVGDWTTNVQPPTVLLFNDPAAGVQQSIVTECRQPAHFYELLMTDP